MFKENIIMLWFCFKLSVLPFSPLQLYKAANMEKSQYWQLFNSVSYKLFSVTDWQRLCAFPKEPRNAFSLSLDGRYSRSHSGRRYQKRWLFCQRVPVSPGTRRVSWQPALHMPFPIYGRGAGLQPPHAWVLRSEM